MSKNQHLDMKTKQILIRVTTSITLYRIPKDTFRENNNGVHLYNSETISNTPHTRSCFVYSFQQHIYTRHCKQKTMLACPTPAQWEHFCAEGLSQLIISII